MRKIKLRRRQNGLSSEILEARQLLAGDLVAHWVAQDLSGTVEAGETPSVWEDRVNQIAAMPAGDPVWVASAAGDRPTLRFDASDGLDLFRIPAATSPMIQQTDFTVVAVFQTSSTGFRDGANWFNQSGIVDGTALGFASDWGIAMDSGGQVTVGVSEGVFGVPSTNLSSNEVDLNDGQRHTVVFRREGDTLSVAIDGNVPATTAGAPTNATDQFTAMVIGGLQVSQGGFTGDIAEVRVYDGALSSVETASVFDEIDTFFQNEPPVANPDSFQVNEDALLFTNAATGVLANDSDADGDSLQAVLVSDVQHGSLSLADDGSFVYDPDPNFFGTDTFRYAARDFRNSEPVEVTIDVAPQHDLVEPQPDTYDGVPTETLSIFNLIGVLANDINVDGVPMQAELVQDDTRGELTLNADGSFTYDPQGFAGTETFQYRVADGVGVSDPTTVTLIINTAPVAQADRFTLNEDEPLVLASSDGVLANDMDADGDELSVELVNGTTHGELSLDDDGALTYQPEQDFFGEDAFTYRVLDGVDDSAVVQVTLQVDPVNDVPVSSSDAYFGVADSAIEISANQGVLNNDSDVDSSSLQAVLVEEPANGSLTLNPDGSFRYQPIAGFTGTDSFRYRASDTQGESEITDVSLFVGSSPLRISEINAANTGGDEATVTRIRLSADDRFRGDDDRPDWIEIQNLSSSPFDLTDFILANDEQMVTQWTFPEGTVVPANSYLLVFASDIAVRDPALDEKGVLHTDFKLSLESEYIGIADPTGNVLHGFEYPDQVAGVSYGVVPGTDGDLGFLLETTPIADNTGAYVGLTPDTRFSVDRGYYDAPIEVEITTDSPEYEIRYTFDGSVPSAENGFVYDQPITIDRTTTLRAATVRDGYLTQDIDTQTYLFPAQLVTQSEAPKTGPSTNLVEFPDAWNRQAADYEMDPEVTNDPQYADKMEDAFRALPSLSLTLPMEDIFGTRGLYSQPESTNENAASAEFFFADGQPGFQIDAGMRMQGGASRRAEHLKHSMSLRFREDYGAAELEYPLFEGSPVSTFDSIHLRARYNNSWIHWDQGQRNRGTLMREMFMRESMLAAGEVAAGHGRYAHVYLNGLYWGIYEMHERQDASHFARYFGGEAHQYSATNANSVVDGLDRSPHNALRDAVRSQDWDLIQQHLDVDNHIRFSILHQFGGNQDLKSDGNWRSAGGGTAGAPWQFYIWDAERVLENVRQRGTTPVSDLMNMMRDLVPIEEYRIRFADALHELLFNDGALTVEATTARWAGLADQLDEAIFAESARWGDARQRIPLTVNERWIPERDRVLNDYLPERTDNVIENFRTRDDLFYRPRGDDPSFTLYPATDAPEFLVDGERQHGGFLGGGMLTVLNPNGAEGTVYFTLDGSDPRLTGGDVNPQATIYTDGPIPLNETTRVRMRILNDGEWSAITDATFVSEVAATSDNLRITEINYHPRDARPEIGEMDVRDREFEFIELRNVSEEAINLQGLQFVQTSVDGDLEGIVYRFGAHSLQPGDSTLVVHNRQAFLSRYEAPPEGFDFASNVDPSAVAGEWTGGSLGNGGETITLVDQLGSIVQQVAYQDDGIWPERADGAGSTLQLLDVSGELNAGSNWTASYLIGGSPGHADDQPDVAVVINELLTNSEDPVVDQIELFNRGPNAVDLAGWSLTDNSDRLDRFVFPIEKTIAPGDYLVLTQDQLGFGLKGQESDEVYLVTDGVRAFADSVQFEATAPNSTLGRWPNGLGKLFPQQEASLGSANSGPAIPNVVLSEIHYNPASTVGNGNAAQLEFVEVWNDSNAPMNIGQWRLDKGVEYSFPQDTVLPVGGGITIVPFDPTGQPDRLAEFQAAYSLPNDAVLMGPYDGVLDNGGENLELRRPVDDELESYILVDRVRYDDQSPWPMDADGQGASLQRATQTFGDDVANWSALPPTPGIDNLGTVVPNPDVFDLTQDGTVDAADIDQLCQWIRTDRADADLDESGQVNLQDLLYLTRLGLQTGPGDANLDGRFNSSDLTLVFQAGEYEDAVAGNSTWVEGDWNCDGEFTTQDLVFAFTETGYTTAAVIAAHASQHAADSPIRFDLGRVAAALHDIGPLISGTDGGSDELTTVKASESSGATATTGQQMPLELRREAVDLLFAN